MILDGTWRTSSVFFLDGLDFKHADDETVSGTGSPSLPRTRKDKKENNTDSVDLNTVKSKSVLSPLEEKKDKKEHKIDSAIEKHTESSKEYIGEREAKNFLIQCVREN